MLELSWCFCGISVTCELPHAAYNGEDVRYCGSVSWIPKMFQFIEHIHSLLCHWLSWWKNLNWVLSLRVRRLRSLDKKNKLLPGAVQEESQPLRIRKHSIIRHWKKKSGIPELPLRSVILSEWHIYSTRNRKCVTNWQSHDVSLY